MVSVDQKQARTFEFVTVPAFVAETVCVCLSSTKRAKTSPEEVKMQTVGGVEVVEQVCEAGGVLVLEGLDPDLVHQVERFQ